MPRYRQMNTPAVPLKVSYRVKVPMIARPNVDATGSLWIPRGSLIEWLPRAINGRGLATIRWSQKEYLVSSAALNQDCERVADGEG